MNNFFNTNPSKSVLERYTHRINAITPSDEFESNRNKLIKLVITSMGSAPEEWDLYCQINIGWIGKSYIGRLSEDGPIQTKSQLDDICSICFRFLLEFYLSNKNDLAVEFEEAKRFVLTNIDEFEPGSKSQIQYAIYEMPISIFKSIANSNSIQSIKDLDGLNTKIKTSLSAWEKDLSEQELRVNELKNSLSKYENAFNFVGLYQGFDDLAKEKIAERDGLLFWIKILSAIIISPILAELFFIYIHSNEISAFKDGILLSIFPSISLIAIAIYYFRVLLFNYKSVKSQLLQIDLRKTLCRFIQNYSEYSTKIKKSDTTSLDKFENIIFSGIVTEDGALPSTFDGIEQLGKLIKSIK